MTSDLSPCLVLDDVPSRRFRVLRRPVSSRDAAFLRELFAESRDDLLVLPPDTRDLIVDMQFRAQRRQQDLDHPVARREILVVDDVAVGLLVIGGDRSTVHVVDFAVRASKRSTGVGSVVLGELIADADLTGRTIRLRVWSANTRARGLYERHGFAHSGSAAGYDEMYRCPSSA